VLSFWLWV